MDLSVLRGKKGKSLENDSELSCVVISVHGLQKDSEGLRLVFSGKADVIHLSVAENAVNGTIAKCISRGFFYHNFH